MSPIKTTMLACLTAAACSTTPKTPAQRSTLESNAQATIGEMTQKDPGLRPILDDAAGYAVFPSIGKGGVIVGGAHGIGMLYEHHRATGFLTLDQASIGAQLGGASFSEILVMRDPAALARLKQGNLRLGAEIGATVVDTGAAESAQFDQGMAAFVLPRGGLMLDVSVSGQSIDYQPLDI
jgi:lipid-binding SYLF domain-containing protein